MKSSWEEAPQLKSPWWLFSPSTLLKSRTRRNVGIFHVHSNQIPSYPLVYKLRWFAALYISEIFLEPFSESETSAMIIVYFSRHTETYYTLWYGVVTPIGRLVLLLLLLWLQWYFQPLTIKNIGRLVLLLVVSFFQKQSTLEDISLLLCLTTSLYQISCWQKLLWRMIENIALQTPTNENAGIRKHILERTFLNCVFSVL